MLMLNEDSFKAGLGKCVTGQEWTQEVNDKK